MTTHNPRKPRTGQSAAERRVDPVALVKKHGILVESGSRHRPVFTEEIAGEVIRGSWWGHRRSHEIFAATRIVRRSPEVLVCRLVQQKVTYVHKSLWPALVRLTRKLGLERLAHIREEHTPSGAHRVRTVPLKQWASGDVQRQAVGLSWDEALGCLPVHIKAALGIDEQEA